MYLQETKRTLHEVEIEVPSDTSKTQRYLQGMILFIVINTNKKIKCKVNMLRGGADKKWEHKIAQESFIYKKLFVNRSYLKHTGQSVKPL